MDARTELDKNHNLGRGWHDYPAQCDLIILGSLDSYSLYSCSLSPHLLIPPHLQGSPFEK